MYCGYCGTEINTKIREPDGTVVCPGCGTRYRRKSTAKPEKQPVVAPATERRPLSMENTQQSIAQPRRAAKRTGAGAKIAVVLLIIALLIGGVVAVKHMMDRRKLQAAYDAIGTIGFSDETILTNEEVTKLQELRNQKETAFTNKSIEELERLDAEWKAFAMPIHDFIDKYKNIQREFFTDSEEELLSSDEEANYLKLRTAIDEAYKSRDDDALETAITEYRVFSEPIAKILKKYTSINQSPFSDKEKEHMTNDEIAEMQNLLNEIETAWIERDISALDSLGNEWKTFAQNTKNRIEEATKPLGIVGKYELPSQYTMFPIGALEFYDDGTVQLKMDWTYKGTYTEKNGRYEITIKEGVGSVAGVTVEEAKKAYSISAELNDDGSLTVFVKAKSGYMYYGSESEIFKRK